MINRRRAGFLLAALALAGGLFSAGFFAGRPDLASRDGAVRILARLGIDGRRGPADMHGGRVIDSALTRLRVDAHLFTAGAPPRSRGGGGIAAHGNEILGVDRRGNFFLFSEPAGFTSLEIDIPTNIDDLRLVPINMEELQEAGIDTADLIRRGLDPSAPHLFNLRSFRFTDVAVLPRNGEVDVFVGYAYWYPDRQCKTLRLVQARIPSLASLAGGFQPTWRMLFETSPCIEFSYRAASGFQSPNNGGRIAFLDEDRVLFSVGDHHLDGFNNDIAASQVDTVSYGKVHEIDVRTLTARVYAKGLRNPQGLFIDDDGIVWETEHGPQGGDELNRLERGVNYGWPHVTHGTQYREYRWPLTNRQGRHAGYELPLHAWVPSIGISAILRLRNFADVWDGDLLIGSLRAGTIFRVTLEDGRVTVVEPIPIGERIRDMVQRDDGTLAIWTDSHRLLLVSADLDSAPASIPWAESLDPGTLEVITGCAACHSLVRDGSSTTAPPLWGVYGRRVGATPYPYYSTALTERTDRWTAQALSQFIRDPEAFAAGSTMPRPEMGDEAQLEGVVQYLRRLR